jgi:hypothetical protein
LIFGYLRVADELEEVITILSRPNMNSSVAEKEAPDCILDLLWKLLEQRDIGVFLDAI